MARIFTDGFELNSLTNGMERFGSSAQGSISSTTVKNSTYSWRCNPSAAAMAINAGLNAGSGIKTVFIRFDFYAVTMPPADALVLLLTAVDLTTTMMRLRGTGSGLKVMNSANTQVGSNIALSTGQWYRIEIKCFSNATTGTIDVLVDGVSAVSNTGLNTQGSDINGLQFGSGAATTSEYFIDNVAVNDTSGSSQTSYPGEGYVICLRPNATGDNADFTRGGSDSGANWSQCDEVTPNDVTDYNNSATLNHTDMFGMSASGIGASDTVNVVHVGHRFANITADGAACIQARVIKTASGTVASGAATTAISSTTWRSNGTSTTAYNPYPITLYADPDASAWTQSTLDSMQCGYKITTGGTNGVAVSAVWAMVDYTPSSGINGTASITLGAVTTSAAGTVALAGTLAKSLDNITTSAAGAVAIAGSAAPTLAAVTTTATGALALVGAAAVALGDVTLASEATLTSGLTGAAAITLDSVTTTAAGAVVIAGTAAPTLADVTTTAAGALVLAGSASVALGDVTLAADAAIVSGRTGAAASTLGGITTTAAGVVAIAGSAAPTLDNVGTTAAGMLALRGAAAIVLDGITLSASTASADTEPGRMRLGYALAPAGAHRLGLASRTPAARRLGLRSTGV